MKFEWDLNKAEKNEKKHGVSFSEATTVFGDTLELTISDPDHSEGEYRFLSIDRSSVGRVLVVSYTEEKRREQYSNHQRKMCYEAGAEAI